MLLALLRRPCHRRNPRRPTTALIPPGTILHGRADGLPRSGRKCWRSRTRGGIRDHAWSHKRAPEVQRLPAHLGEDVSVLHVRTAPGGRRPRARGTRRAAGASSLSRAARRVRRLRTRVQARWARVSGRPGKGPGLRPASWARVWARVGEERWGPSFATREEDVVPLSSVPCPDDAEREVWPSDGQAGTAERDSLNGRHRRYRFPARPHPPKVLYGDNEHATILRAAGTAGLRSSSYVAAAALAMAEQVHSEAHTALGGPGSGQASTWRGTWRGLRRRQGRRLSAV